MARVQELGHIHLNLILTKILNFLITLYFKFYAQEILLQHVRVILLLSLKSEVWCARVCVWGVCVCVRGGGGGGEVKRFISRDISFYAVLRPLILISSFPCPNNISAQVW